MESGTRTTEQLISELMDLCEQIEVPDEVDEADEHRSPAEVLPEGAHSDHGADSFADLSRILKRQSSELLDHAKALRESQPFLGLKLLEPSRDFRAVKKAFWEEMSMRSHVEYVFCRAALRSLFVSSELLYIREKDLHRTTGELRDKVGQHVNVLETGLKTALDQVQQGRDVTDFLESLIFTARFANEELHDVLEDLRCSA
jgi:hypothetical protein